MSRSDIIIDKFKKEEFDLKGKSIPDKDYFALPAINASLLKSFDIDEYRFYKKYIEETDDSEDEDDEDTDSTVLGSMVHCLTLEGQEKFDDNYVISTVNKPSGQALKFVNELFRLTKKYSDEKGIIQKEFTEMAQEAYNNLKFDKFTGQIVDFKRDSFEKVLETFYKGIFKKGETEPQCIPSEWYNELRRTYGKKLVSQREMSLADSMSKSLLEGKFTSEIMNIKTDNKYTVYNEYIIEGKYDDFNLKCKVDKIIVNHKTKRVDVFDIKTVYDINAFSFTYKKLRYYLQLAMYYYLINNVLKDLGKGYIVGSFKFLIVDAVHLATIVNTKYEHYLEAMEGFTDQYNEHRRGLKQLLYDLEWSKKNNMWRCKRSIYENNGILDLKLLGKEQYLNELIDEN